MNMIPTTACPICPTAAQLGAPPRSPPPAPRGVLTKLRQSAGQDVDGGCGQLRARAQAEAEAPLHWQPGAARRAAPLSD
jgi:23S rRNA (adenine2503-C2)-methyltransferase